MTSIIYKGEAIYAIQNTEKKHNIHLYIERQDAKYNCIAYNPDNNYMIGHCCFTEPLFDIGNAAAKAVEIMQIEYASIKRIKRQAKMIDITQEPDIKINILKALAEQAHQQNYKSDIINNILKIIEML